jgi:transcriptional regulator with XRE-family HTH domain
MTDPATPPGRSHRWITTLDGHRLRHLRHQAGLSQAGLADQAGISLTAITRLERQRNAPCRPRTLGRLAAALGQPPASLTGTTRNDDPAGS